MNAVEIEAAISDLALEPFDTVAFPFAFLEAFGHKDTTIKRLKSGNNNASDVNGGVLLRNNIHLLSCEQGKVGDALSALRTSPATTKAKAKFILATDGLTIESEDLIGGETLTCDYTELPNHFGFFLSLAGISTIKEIKDNPIDVRATGRLNKLYVELLRENPDWAAPERRHDMNHFMARLVFCFFAEDTDIFLGKGLFTQTIQQMSEADGSNTHEVMSEIFLAMNVPTREGDKLDDRHRKAAGLRPWADQFPYVNGGLFAGSTDVPRFTRMARTYLLHAGSLRWREINPDIFGSMIQAVADDDERGALGMHYTSVPNILKVLNPLFLDELRAQLELAGDNKAKLLNLRKRMARIRVFDPACGSGNFLVIAYKQMREIEAVINARRGEDHLKSELPLTNYRGIELRDFPAEIARLALIIAEFQCDVKYRGQKDALLEFLPLNAENWIVCGNALRLDWLSICPPTGTGVKVVGDDLFNTPLDQTEIDFANEGGETYICGNPPYVGDKKQSKEQKGDLEAILARESSRWRSLDYISGFFYKAAQVVALQGGAAAFVSTNSICQGQQVNVLWPLILRGTKITSARTSFKWANLAANNAGVTVVIVQLGALVNKQEKRIYDDDSARTVGYISPYLTSQETQLVSNAPSPLSDLPSMTNGNAPKDGGNLILNSLNDLPTSDKFAASVVKQYWGADEIISGNPRYCFWLESDDLANASQSVFLTQRIDGVRASRLKSDKAATREWAKAPHRFVEIRRPQSDQVFAMPAVTTENRLYLTPILLKGQDVVVTNAAFVMYDPPIWALGILTSKLHYIWIATVCGKLETRYRYSNTLGWNTFPVPLLTEQNKADLTECAENILLAREVHFPATIADLYDPEAMPENLRHAHERNDEVLERIYIGRRFKNDTERLEKLFELYTKMTAKTTTKTAAGAMPSTKIKPAKKTARDTTTRGIEA